MLPGYIHICLFLKLVTCVQGGMCPNVSDMAWLDQVGLGPIGLTELKV